MIRSTNPGFCLEGLSQVNNGNIPLSLKGKKILIVTAFIDEISYLLETDISSLFQRRENYIEDISSRLKFFPYDIVIATDGGLNLCDLLNITPNIVLGDFDSQNIEDVNNIPKEILPVEKDNTDMEVALDRAIAMGAEEILILGGMGGRVDHTLANIYNLVTYGKRLKNIAMIDLKNYITVQFPSTKTYSSKLGKHFSLFSYEKEARGVTYKGAYYPMIDGIITREFPLGVSNSFLKDEIQVTLKEGTIIIAISDNK